MPTARELLEQADALMRRNRSAMIDDIPVLTDSVPAPAVPRALRPRVPAARATAAPPPRAADPIPTLTERVSPGPPPEKDAVVEEGEPSDWLQLGAGEPSVIGEAPDSIAIVPALPHAPPLTEEIVLKAPPEAERAFDEELASRRAPAAPPPLEAPQAASREVPPSAASLAAAFEHVEAPSEGPFVEDESLLGEPTITTAEDDEAASDALEEDAAGAREEGVESSGWGEAEGADVEASAVEIAGEPAAEPQAPQRAPEPFEDALLGAPLETTATLVAAASAENARWSSMAEEIRVQVLQRIDLFTDTGLRAQLGARLQPIVDRASADLVATINQHVGELLRAYVAEAIEREIESWRRNTSK
ncbi:MAG TPA: hypothetical protein VMN56_02325 [Casimicrobiaceae bacterium]|nr:hypothetical protein [Casimicrobiaceae bacterium]